MMSRRNTAKKRSELSEPEYQNLLEAVDAVCGPRPPGTRMDPQVASWKWARNWIRGMSESQLNKQLSPPASQEIREIVNRYAEAAFG